MRELIASNKDFAARVEKLERGQDRLASEVKGMQALPPVTKRKIGFVADED